MTMRTDPHLAVARHVFSAMGTSVALVTPAGVPKWDVRQAILLVERAFAEQEQRFSRFRPDSELSEVNGAGPGSLRLSRPFAALMRCALQAAAETDGLFDPTVLPAMVAAGYDRSFEDIIVRAREVLRPDAPTGRWREISLAGDRLTMPEGIGLVSAGSPRGGPWIEQRSSSKGSCRGRSLTLAATCALWVTRRPNGLQIGVEHPFDPHVEVLRLALIEGALATSSTARRSWGPNLHHLIDPRTGRPAVTDVVQATAWARTCAEAEVRAKVALLRGVAALDETAATLVLEDGTVMTSMGAGAEGSARSDRR